MQSETNSAAPVVVSVDIEATGPSPSVASMLSIGAVAYVDGEEQSTFYATLTEESGPLGTALRDANTMEWWTQWPEQWALATLNPKTPRAVMPSFAEWAEALPGQPVFMAWPAGFDWSFVCHYLWKYVGRNPFGYSPLCLGAFGCGITGNVAKMLGGREEEAWPDNWIIKPEFPHHALHDARAQGRTWLAMLAHIRDEKDSPDAR